MASVAATRIQRLRAIATRLIAPHARAMSAMTRIATAVAMRVSAITVVARPKQKAALDKACEEGGCQNPEACGMLSHAAANTAEVLSYCDMSWLRVVVPVVAV